MSWPRTVGLAASRHVLRPHSMCEVACRRFQVACRLFLPHSMPQRHARQEQPTLNFLPHSMSQQHAAYTQRVGCSCLIACLNSTQTS